MELDEILEEAVKEIERLENNINALSEPMYYVYQLPIPEGRMMKPDGELFYYNVG